MEKFLEDENIVKDKNKYYQLIYKGKKVNAVYKDDFIYLFKDKNIESEYRFLTSIEEFIIYMYKFDLDLENVDFISYRDMGLTSNVIMCFKSKNGWVGGSHRGMYNFQIGETINLNEMDILLKHGYLANEEYEKEEKSIEEIKSLIDKEGNIFIANNEIAKKLAIRLTEVLG